MAVVGAGPYALSTALFLRRAGIEARLFGEVMGFWRTMPHGMFLRSYRKASSIADPEHALNLDAYEAHRNKELGAPISLADFVDYGMWFQQQAQIDVDPRLVNNVTQNGKGFELMLSDGESLHATAVVVAAGIACFAWKPAVFDGLGASHTSELRDYSGFRGRRVLVLGAGQSALESAAFLNDVGAQTELVVRQPALRFLHGEGLNEANGLMARILYPEWAVGPPGLNLLMGRPELFRHLPRRLAEPLAYRAIRPTASVHLQPRLVGVTVTTGRAPTSAAAADSGVRVVLDDGTERIVDHVVLGTGYRIDLRRYSFLDAGLRSRIQLNGSSPKLLPALESSVPGLYFVGAPAAASAGPGFRFVSHSGFAARAITKSITRA